MGQTTRGVTVSSSTIRNDDTFIDGRYAGVTAAGLGPAAPTLANFGTATASVSGNRVRVVQTAGTATTGATITVLHRLGRAPRAVAVVPVGGNTTAIEPRVLPATITATQFVISVAVAPGGTSGTYEFEVYPFL
jgi:hypothetical protein